MQDKHYYTALSIAGLDPSGGAGVLADVKTFSALGVYGMAAVTALTIQNTMGVERVEAVEAQTVYDQVVAVMRDIHPDAVKIGMVGNAATIEAIAKALEERKPRWIVVDPIILSSSGKPLMAEDALATFVERLLPLASIVTPNMPEAKRLAEACGMVTLSSEEYSQSSLEEMAIALMRRGVSSVLIKGGHADGDEKVDRLYVQDGISNINVTSYTAHKIITCNTHGTGCTLSSAISAYLACGCDLPDAVGKAKTYLTRALKDGADVLIGHGHGSLNHLFAPEQLMKA